MSTPIQAAIDHFGGIPKLAEALGVAVPTVYQWADTDKPLPISLERAIQIEKVTGGKVRAEDLVPEPAPGARGVRGLDRAALIQYLRTSEAA